MEKRLRVFRAHSRRVLLLRSKVIKLLKSLRHGCQIVRRRRTIIKYKNNHCEGREACVAQWWRGLYFGTELKKKIFAF